MQVQSHRDPSTGLGWSRRVIWSLLACVVAVITAVGPAASATAAEEGTIHALANQSRSSAGLPPLTLNGSLSQVALGWAQHMGATRTLAHNPSYASQIPPGWQAAGENVAQGYRSASAVHEGWMNSPGHRANILGDYTDIGIAHISAGGTTWSVQVFAKYPRSAAAPPPRAPEAAPAPAQPVPAPPPASAPQPETAPAPEADAPAPPPEIPAEPGEGEASEDEASENDDASRSGESDGDREATASSPQADSRAAVGDVGDGGALVPTAIAGGAALVAALLATVAWMWRRPSKSDCT